MKRLGVNIDHVATLRNARGEIHPDPVFAARFVKKAGADSITIHLTEDRRHINDLDAKKICSIKNISVNLEISTNTNIVKTAINDDEKYKNDIIQYSAGGLRDFTRIAASDPIMWRDIFIDNSENILQVLDNYSKNLDEIKTAIKNKDGEKLMKIFSSTKKVRKEIIKAGQDTDKPGFGRK